MGDVVIIGTCRELRYLTAMWADRRYSIGFVPTMGFLHEGHGSLIRRSVAENDRTLVSVFVNPTQFAPGEDLESYPRDLARDIAYCDSLDANAVFHPEASELYPPDFATTVSVPSLSAPLCGRDRPTHFQGVCVVVLKLLNLVKPNRAYFGLKDAQQYFVLSRMARDLDLDCELVPCPTVREPDGLALSSRNGYLSPEERAAAPTIHKALVRGRELMDEGAPDDQVLAAIREECAKEPLLSLDYVEIVDSATMAPREHPGGEVLVAIAARIGKTRLIDNFIHPASDEQCSFPF
jgi:pantoate--beta-alanine ligase